MHAYEHRPTPRRTMSNGNPSSNSAPFQRSSTRRIFPVSSDARVPSASFPLSSARVSTITSLRTTNAPRSKGAAYRVAVRTTYLFAAIRSTVEGAARSGRNIAGRETPRAPRRSLAQRDRVLERDVGRHRRAVRAAGQKGVHLLQHERRGRARRARPRGRDAAFVRDAGSVVVREEPRSPRALARAVFLARVRARAERALRDRARLHERQPGEGAQEAPDIVDVACADAIASERRRRRFFPK